MSKLRREANASRALFSRTAAVPRWTLPRRVTRVHPDLVCSFSARATGEVSRLHDARRDRRS